MKRSRWNEFLFLLRREFLFQLDGRRAFPRGVYPGVNWFALLCIGALLLEFNASRVAPESSSTALQHFLLLTSCLAFLITLRSAVYCALSMSRDLQSHTATIVRVSPLSSTVTLAAKLCACLAPLWTELLLFLPVSLLFFSVYLWLSPVLVVAVVPLLMAISLASGCLGLVIGSATDQPLQAARNARLFVFFSVFMAPILKAMSEGWILPLAAFSLWLSLTTRWAPHRKVVLSSFGLLLGSLACWSYSGWGGFSLGLLHPLYVSNDLLSSNLRQGALSVWPTGALMTHPTPLILLYLGLAALFFLLARVCYRYLR